MSKTESFVDKLKKKNNLVAILYILISVFIFSTSNLISKILIENNKTLGFDSINFVMGITMLVINIFLRERELISENNLKYQKRKESSMNNNNDHSKIYFNSSFVSYEKIDNQKNSFIYNMNNRNTNYNLNKSKLKSNNELNSESHFLHVFSDIKKELDKDFNRTCIFIIRCLLGTFAEIFLFFSFKDLRINTAVTLYTVYPIISSFLSYLYLESNSNKSSKSQIMDFLFLIFCMIFVTFITKPEFVFGAPNASMKQDSFIGFVNIMLSVLCNAFAIFFHKKLAESFNNYTFNIFFGINFILFSFFLIIFDKFTVLNLDLITVFLLLIMSLLFNISQTLFNLSIKLGEIVVVLPVSYLSIVMGFINNILFLNGVWDAYDLIGSFGIIFINVYRIILISQEE